MFTLGEPEKPPWGVLGPENTPNPHSDPNRSLTAWEGLTRTVICPF